MTRYSDPYKPLAVPTAPEGADPHFAELERYLTDEMGRISTSIQQTAVMAAYGGLAITATGPVNTIGTTPEQVFDWDTIIPTEPNRMVPGEFNDSLRLEEFGTYYATCQITADTSAGRIYRITLAVNGVLSTIYAEWDTSNQTDSVNMIFVGMGDFDAGDEVSVFVQASLDGSEFTPKSGIFMLHRISELRRVY